MTVVVHLRRFQNELGEILDIIRSWSSNSVIRDFLTFPTRMLTPSALAENGLPIPSGALSKDFSSRGVEPRPSPDLGQRAGIEPACTNW